MSLCDRFPLQSRLFVYKFLNIILNQLIRFTKERKEAWPQPEPQRQSRGRTQGTPEATHPQAATHCRGGFPARIKAFARILLYNKLTRCPSQSPDGWLQMFYTHVAHTVAQAIALELRNCEGGKVDVLSCFKHKR